MDCSQCDPRYDQKTCDRCATSDLVNYPSCTKPTTAPVDNTALMNQCKTQCTQKGCTGVSLSVINGAATCSCSSCSTSSHAVAALDHTLTCIYPTASCIAIGGKQMCALYNRSWVLCAMSN